MKSCRFSLLTVFRWDTRQMPDPDGMGVAPVLQCGILLFRCQPLGSGDLKHFIKKILP
jgi:hypothetical protein